MEKTTRKAMARGRGTYPIFHLLSLIFYLFAGCEQHPPEVTEPELPGIKIGSAAELRQIGQEGYPLNRRYVLTADITVNNWTPLAQTVDFPGVFDGAGHTITITGTKGGLFNSMSGATVQNLNVIMTVTVTAAAGRAAIVGGIAGFAERSLIDNCTAVVNMTVTGHAHNSSAGGIVGTMLDYTTVRNCAASGTVTLNGTGADSEGAGLMVYAGGVVGYSGNGETNGKASGCLIMRSQWTDGTVSASSGYPYAGGVVGYNYSGARTSQCSSAGTVTATGENLPYAGGVAGYNSGYVTDNPGTVSLIDNCYSAATVMAVSTSRAALAGGIAGANALRACISKCYARGAVTATVAGSGDNIGGSAGVMIAANAGGIAGAQYFENNPVIQYCAALNSSVTGAETPGSSGAVWNVYRIAGAGDGTHNTGVFDNNIAWEMTMTSRAGSWDKAAAGKDGADSAQKPAQGVFTDMGWDFGEVWQMAADGWPSLR